MKKLLALVALIAALLVVHPVAQGPEARPEKEPILDLGRMAGLLMGMSFDTPPQGDTSVIDVLWVFSDPVWTKLGATEALARSKVADPVTTQWTTTKTNEAAGGNITPIYPLGVLHSSYNDVLNNASCLNWMSDTSPTGGYNEVMGEMRRIGADIAHCVTNGSDNCGLGYLYASANGTPFSASHYDGCTVNNLSGIHEMGHNHGLNHEPQSACSAPTCNGYNYGFGWGGPASGQSVERDPMTYPREGGSRVLWWSSPLFQRTIAGIQYTIGTADHNDNLRQLIAYGPTIAGFRARTSGAPFPVPRPPGKTDVLSGRSYITLALSPDNDALIEGVPVVSSYAAVYYRLSDGTMAAQQNCGKPQNGNCTIPLTLDNTTVYYVIATVFGPGGSAAGPASNPFTKQVPATAPAATGKPTVH